MSESKNPQLEPGKLQIELNSDDLQVSYVSSMLRVLQAAVRDIAKGVDCRPSAIMGRFQTWN
jgi:hypothetical protein